MYYIKSLIALGLGVLLSYGIASLTKRDDIFYEVSAIAYVIFVLLLKPDYTNPFLTIKEEEKVRQYSPAGYLLVGGLVIFLSLLSIIVKVFV